MVTSWAEVSLAGRCDDFNYRSNRSIDNQPSTDGGTTDAAPGATAGRHPFWHVFRQGTHQSEGLGAGSPGKWQQGVDVWRGWGWERERLALCCKISSLRQSWLEPMQTNPKAFSLLWQQSYQVRPGWWAGDDAQQLGPAVSVPVSPLRMRALHEKRGSEVRIRMRYLYLVSGSTLECARSCRSFQSTEQ